MSIRTFYITAGLAALVTAGFAGPTQALSMKECGQQYRAARSAGTLGGMTWNEFRKAQCGPGASATRKQAPTARAPAQAPRQNQGDGGIFGGFGSGQNTTTSPGWFGGQQKYSFGGAVFPQAVAPQYRNLSAGRARMRTCLDQYRANKSTGGNSNLRWIQKGGGYYSVCNRHLKGQ